MIRVSYSSNIQAPQERHVFSKRVYGARITLMEQKNAWANLSTDHPRRRLPAPPTTSTDSSKRKKRALATMAPSH